MTLPRLALLLVALALAAPSAALAGAPGATTGDAKAISATGATLTGTVNPNKEETRYFFEYGTTTAYGAKTAEATVSGNAGKAVEAAITGLTPGTVYHFRLVAINPSGRDEGNDRTFTTLTSPYVVPGANAVTIAASPARIRWGTTSVISGQVTGANNANVQVQLQDNPYPFKNFKNVGTPVRTDAAGRYSFFVKPTRLTRYQVVARTSPPVTSAIVQVQVRYRVSFKVGDSRVFRGQRVRFRGSVWPAHDGRLVRIQRRTRTGSFRTVATTTLRKSSGGRSSYSKRIRIRRKGTYRVRVTADADHAKGTSRRRTIRIG